MTAAAHCKFESCAIYIYSNYEYNLRNVWKLVPLAIKWSGHGNEQTYQTKALPVCTTEYASNWALHTA